MNTISNISNSNLAPFPKKIDDANQNTKNQVSSKTSELSSAKLTINESTKNEKKPTYTVDMDKVNSMKAETEQRLIDLFRSTVKKGSLKQLSGVKGYVLKLKDYLESDSEDISLESDIEITDEAIKKAQSDIAEDGYWGAEATSDRFLEFAIALSGGDSSKADMLLDAVKKGFDDAEKIWGSELPKLSQKTLELTIEKFQKWKDNE